MTRGRSTESDSSGRQRQDKWKSRSKTNIKCYNCGKNGHLKNDYWNLKGSSPQVNFASASDDDNVYKHEKAR